MASERQRAANRRNRRSSTRPETAAGRAAASRHALGRSLTAESAALSLDALDAANRSPPNIKITKRSQFRRTSRLRTGRAAGDSPAPSTAAEP